jgi:hypothetical protein
VVVPSSVETLPAPEPEWANLPAWASGSAGPGRFRSLFFEPALRLELGPAWVTTEEGSNTTGTMRPLVWSEAQAFSAIYFYSHHNLDDTVVEEPPTAQELIERIDNHESTTNVSLTAVQIGGVPATKVEFDLTGNLLYIRTRGADGSNLLHDFETSSEIAIYVLEVRDNTVSIVLESQAPSKLDDLEKRAQPVLDSIVWRDPSS